MRDGWGGIIRQFRLRHAVGRQDLAALIGVPSATLALWENGNESPDVAVQTLLRDLVSQPPTALMESLAAAVANCPLPRALSRTPKLKLQVLSRPALEKRPSMADWIGRDMTSIATGVLQEMLDDKTLQQAIRRREIAGVVATTASVLRTAEAETIGTYRTTITYFSHDGTLYSDAISLPVSAEERCGYTPITVDELGEDLFGDRDTLEAALQSAGDQRIADAR